MGNTIFDPTETQSKFLINDYNLNWAERLLLNQCNYRWVQNDSKDKSDPYYGKKVISYYDNSNWTDVKNPEDILLKH